MKIGEDLKAIEGFSFAIQLNVKNVSAYYLRGRAYANLDMNNFALADLNLAQNLGILDHAPHVKVFLENLIQKLRNP